jgi:exonuclease III
MYPARANLLQELQDVLPEHTPFYRPTKFNENPYKGTGFPVDFELSFGLASFVRKDIPGIKEGKVAILRHKEGVDDEYAGKPGTLQWVQIESNGRPVTIAQFHGLRTSEGKGDTPARLQQSESVKKFIEERRKEGKEVVLCGDFNMAPDTESMSILEKGMRNLIKDYGITSTRSELYERANRYSDYILTSPGIKVVKFEAVKEPVISDHLPLYMEFQ